MSRQVVVGWSMRGDAHIGTLGDYCVRLVWIAWQRKWQAIYGRNGIAVLAGPAGQPPSTLDTDGDAEARHYVGRQLVRIRREIGEFAPQVERVRTLRRKGRPPHGAPTIHRRAGPLESNDGMRARTHCGIVVLLSSATDDPDAVICGSCRNLSTGGHKGIWTSRKSGAKLPTTGGHQ